MIVPHFIGAIIALIAVLSYIYGIIPIEAALIITFPVLVFEVICWLVDRYLHNF